MPVPLSSTTWFTRLRPLVAGGTAALVLLLAAFAVSPELHHLLHDEAGGETDACAVMLFSNGVSLPLDHVAVTVPRTTEQIPARRLVEEIFLVRVRYLWQPERGPPVS